MLGLSAAYHGYWVLDFTTVDPHLGTEADFAAFVDCAHRLGLKVYLDVVVNHTADVILPQGGSSWAGTPRTATATGGSFDPARYAGGRTFPCLNLRSFPRTPSLFPGDAAAKQPAWLNDVTALPQPRRHRLRLVQRALLRAGRLLRARRPLHRAAARSSAGWRTSTGSGSAATRSTAFRIDTARHVDEAFFGVWVPKILAAARAAGVPDFQLFGEVFIANAIELVPFVRERGLPNVLDFPLQEALAGFAGGDAGARGIATRLGDDDYFRLADGARPCRRPSSATTTWAAPR